MVRAIYPGTFDPVTNGHVDMVERSSEIFQDLTVCVYRDSPKQLMFNADERVEMFRQAIKHIPGVEVMSYVGLTVDLAHRLGASVIVRGLRIGSDFEYEREMALMNRSIGSDVETVCLLSHGEFEFVSSSRVKEIAALGGNVRHLVPANVAEPLYRKLRGADGQRA